MKKVIRTARLELRPLTPADALMIFTLNADKEVMRYLAEGEGHASVAAAELFLKGFEARAKDVPFSRWAVVRQEDGVVMGWCGLKRLPDGSVDLGYRLLREYWGNGYATESGRCWLAYGFQEAGLQRIIGNAADGNLGSQAVLTKLGFRRAPAEDHQSKGFLWRRFELLVEDFSAAS